MTMRVVDLAIARRVRRAVKDATLAASVHNSQPWRFVVVGSRVELWLDPAVRPTVIDPDGRLVLASLGAAAANLELGLRCRLQRAVHLDLLPGEDVQCPGRRSAAPWGSLAWVPVARATCGPAAVPASAREVQLHGAIASRHTSRQPLCGGASRSDWGFVREAAGSAPCGGDAVQSVRPDAIQTAMLLEIAVGVDTRWRQDVAYLAEIECWSPTRDGRGVPAQARGPRDAFGKVTARDFSVGVRGDHWRPADAHFEMSPQLLAVTTVDDDQRAWVRSGYAMQRAMLAATARGLDVGVLGQIVEDPEARRSAGAVLGLTASTVQQVLRLGRPGADRPPVRTPRRALRQVMSS